MLRFPFIPDTLFCRNVYIYFLSPSVFIFAIVTVVPCDLSVGWFFFHYCLWFEPAMTILFASHFRFVTRIFFFFPLRYVQVHGGGAYIFYRATRICVHNLKCEGRRKRPKTYAVKYSLNGKITMKTKHLRECHRHSRTNKMRIFA